MTDPLAPLWDAATRQRAPLGEIHGPAHWRRVERIGLRLAEQTGADLLVVRLFAVLHDAARQSDGSDPDHGPRAALLAAHWRGELFALDDVRFALLSEACELHTFGERHSDVTIGTCWDADRLDLARLGIRPDPDRLSTEAALEPEIQAWAWRLAERSPH